MTELGVKLASGQPRTGTGHSHSARRDPAPGAAGVYMYGIKTKYKYRLKYRVEKRPWKRQESREAQAAVEGPAPQGRRAESPESSAECAGDIR